MLKTEGVLGDWIAAPGRAARGDALALLPQIGWSVANICSSSFELGTPRIVRFVGGNRGRCPTPQTPPLETTQ